MSKLDTLTKSVSELFEPSLRLGITGLSRSGKTVFISALVYNLIHGGRLNSLAAVKSGRFIGAHLQAQPDPTMARFDYETHIANIINDRTWPESTFQIAELRLTIEYQPKSVVGKLLGNGRLHVDIVDYPGEWLLDLPLMEKDYATWAGETLQQSRQPSRKELATKWHDRLDTIDPNATYEPTLAKEVTELFVEYLKACRSDESALSRLPPGRFLMPGDLAGSPAMTFAPLDVENPVEFKQGSLGEHFERNFNAYKNSVVQPFFRDHFSRLDRQIVLIDPLPAINAGPNALQDLKHALTEILRCFNPGKNSWLTKFLPFMRRIDKVLVAATKADHIYHSDHNKLKRVMNHLVDSATVSATEKGAIVEVAALASVRSTTEGVEPSDDGDKKVIIGTPMEGVEINGTRFDGTQQIGMFPGDFPESIKSLFQVEQNDSPESNPSKASEENSRPLLHFIRFRPPNIGQANMENNRELPHIRLDSALEFLIGDKLL